MADNTTLNTGSGGDTIATDDLAGVKHQRVKVEFGADGSATDVSAANPLPIAQTGALPAGANAIGKLAANSGVDIGDVDVTSSALPTGASTAAKQPALGTAGTASADVISIQGIAAMTAVKVDGSGVTQPVSGTVTANLGTAAVTNAGTFAVQDSEKVADDAAFTVGTTKLTPVGMLADQAATDSVNEGDIGAPRITLSRQQIVTVSPSADTEGLSIAKNLDIDETEDAIKATAGKLYGWYLYNAAATVVYVKFYNDTVANVIVGTTVPVMTVPVPAGAAANVEFANGIAFSAAITVAATTAVADNDTGAPALNSCVGNFFYA